MKEIILDAVVDSLKNLPFLFGAYLLIEFLEHRASHRLTGALARLGPLGPLGGALLGCVPQCGFSVAAANFYAGGLITPGTLLAVFLATSDEALPILLSRPQALGDLGRLLAVKIVAGFLVGFLTDFAVKSIHLSKSNEACHDLCQHCGCQEGSLVRPALKHTLQVFGFLLAINLALGCTMELAGQAAISRLLLSGSIWQPFLAAAIGFLPHCAASVLLMELYLAGSLSFGSAIAGLCTGAGLGLAVLFRVHKNYRENFILAGILYAAAVVTGLLCQIIF